MAKGSVRKKGKKWYYRFYVEDAYHSFGLLTGGFLALLGVDRLEHLSHQLHLGARRDREQIGRAHV